MYELAAPRLAEPAESLQMRFWAVAILLFGVGDVVTTSVGLGMAGLAEVGPLTAPLIHQYGLGGMVGLKLIAFCGFYLLWRIVPRPHCMGVPLGLAMVGITVTLWNLHLLFFATPL